MAGLSATIARSTAPSPLTLDITAKGGADYMVANGDNYVYKRKNVTSLFGTPTSTWSFADNNDTYSGYEISGTDGKPSPATFAITRYYGGFTDPGQYWEVTAPAGLAERTLELTAHAFSGSSFSITATLSDGSVSPVTLERNTDGTGSGNFGFYQLIYSAGSDGQTLTIRVTCTATGAVIRLGHLWLSEEASSGVTAALTGQSITIAQGSLTESVSYALTSQVIASSQGSFTDFVSKALNGQVITSQQGALSGAVNKALTGQQVTVSQGTISADNAITRALTGQSITASQGDVSKTVENALTGHSASVNQGNLTNAVTYGITGQSATSSQGTIADSVLVGLTGQQITSAQGDVLSNGDVTRALSGQSITAQQGVLTAPQENLFGGVAHFKKLSERSRKLRELEAKERTEAPTSEDIAEVVQIPQEVKEVISNVAKIDNEKKQRAQLKAQLKALEIQFKQEYADALKTEMIRQYLIIEQERQDEEETIAMMMMALV